MKTKRYVWQQWWIIVGILLGAGLMAGCSQTKPESLPDIKTSLLVRAPDKPLPTDKTIEVKSQTQAAGGVSHVELYAKLSNGEEVLLRSDPAPAPQTSFIAAQSFTPREPGHYVIYVIGYNKLGKPSTSDYIGFDVVKP